MLRGALKEHEKKSGQSSLSGFSSQSSSQNTASQSQSVNPGYKNPLKPTTASTLNGLKTAQPLHRSGVKRTASGLAKSFDGAFDDDVGTRYQPIVVGGASRNGMSSGAQNTLFDENEFDSDIELEMDEPMPKAAEKITYPELPKIPPQSSTYKSTYPTTMKQLPARPSPSRISDNLVDFAHPSGASPTKTQAPNSSAPLPWSSSPVEHLQPSAPPQRSLQQYAFDGKVAQQSTSAQPKPAKRRTLPWLDTAASEASSEPTRSVTSTLSMPRTSLATPAPSKEKKDKSMYPWNTTASAVKEQQRKHREETRKVSSKKVDGTEESVDKATTKQKRPARVFLSEEQQHVLELVIEKKKSVFFTGSAGTGKSVLMREIISSLRKKFSREPDRVAVTASTGLAACNVGGVTLHSFAGIGLGKEDVPELVRKIKRNQKAKHRWMRTKVLVLDEVSMVDGELFDKLESIARQIRNNGRPFGGIQLVITGDFFQLPPVPDGSRASKFAFDASTWSTSIEHTIGLHHVFRQKDPGKLPRRHYTSSY